MGRISEKSNRYRTKDRMVEDLVFVLTSPLSYGTKAVVIDNISWVWTEFSGKYKGCEWWSEGAILEYAADPKTKRLRHEHIVPKQIMLKLLLELESPSTDVVRALCERFLIGTVVSVEEHDMLNVEFARTMPPEFFDPASADYHDPWLRYKRCGIKVVQRCWT